MFRISTLGVLALFSFFSVQSQSFTLSSPSGLVRLKVATENSLTYTVSFKGKKVIEPSSLGFKLGKPEALLTQFAIVKTDSSAHDETWTPVWGEVSKIRNNYKELILSLKAKSGSNIAINVIFRIFDDKLFNALPKHSLSA